MLCCIVHPGNKYRDIGNVIQQHAHANGCSVVRSYCGHGINQLVIIIICIIIIMFNVVML